MAVKPIIFTNEYKYYFLYIDQDNDDICVGKADLHINEHVKFSELNTEFIKAYDNIDAGITTSSTHTNSTNTTNDDDEYYSDEDSGIVD
jgi:hypothetical protein